MKNKTYNKNSVIRGALRRAFARSPLVIQKLQESRREVPRYNKDGSRHKKNWVQRQCEVCLDWTSSKNIKIDHISPVIPVAGHDIQESGEQDWNQFVDRLWCDISNLQRICDTCHNKKTQEERISRLLKKYIQELSEIHQTINDNKLSFKESKKLLSKYIAKKKVSGLEPVVEKAHSILDSIEKLSK